MNYAAPEQIDGPSLLIEVCELAVKRGWRICANPRDRAQAVDSMEQVGEDPRWYEKHDSLPQLELHHKVPRGRIGFFNPQTRQITGLISKVQGSKSGLGRVGKLWLPGHYN